MPKTKVDVAVRRAFAQRVQAVLQRAPYGNLYTFQQRHPELAGRVATWVPPQSRRANRGDYEALVMPDGASLASFVKATRVSSDWLLGLIGTADTPIYTYELIPSGTLETMLAERVRAEVEARVHAEPVEGFGSWMSGALVATDTAGAQLVAAAVDAAEHALRAALPVERKRRVLLDVIEATHNVAAQQPFTDAGDNTVTTLRRAKHLLQNELPAPATFPLADAPPVRFAVDPSVYLEQRRVRPSSA